MAVNAISQERTLVEHIASVNVHAEELAAAGEWEEVAELLVKRNAMLREVDDADKEEALRASLRSTDNLRQMAEKAKSEIGRELGQLQRGREATERYGLNT